MARRLLLHVTLLALGFAGLRLAVVPAEVCPVVTAAQVSHAADEAAAWIVRNMRDDGRYLYGYDRDGDEISAQYNGTRHAGVTMSLYQYAAAAGRPEVVAHADRGLAFMLERLTMGAGWEAWRPPGEDVQLGANALLVAALVMRRNATSDPAYDEAMRSVGRFLLAQQQPDGRMYALWDEDTGEAVPVSGKFATGEAAWALALLEGEFPGEGWGEAALPTLDYLALHRDRDEGNLTRMPDHWAAYALAEVGPAGLDGVRRAYARQLAGYFGIRLRFEAQRRGTGINLWLRWVPGTPAGVGTAGEGIAALWRLARAEPGLADLLPNVEERLACFAGMMVSRQATAADAAGYPRPGLVQGAWFYRGYVQMDDVQHVLSGLLAARPMLEQREVAG
ncbi:MAG: hypothetical protein JW785_05910 [Acidimicrobiia bacterium]|nr:hypothetical protein [Acidimicrobiia bacterium]